MEVAVKTLALTGVGLGLCGVAALASPLVTLLIAGGRSRPAATGATSLDALRATAGPGRTDDLPTPHRGTPTPGHPAAGRLPFIPAQRTRN